MQTTDLKPGQRFTKNGQTFTIQLISNGQVYGVMYREGFSYSDEWDENGNPQGYLGNMRIKLADFLKDIEGAEVTQPTATGREEVC